MGNRRNATIENLRAELRRGYELNEAGNHEEAAEVVRAVLERGKAAGFTSAFALWNLAISSDQGGNLEMAFDYITQALQLDPIAQPFHNSFEIIVKRIREALAAEGRALDDPSTPRLYELLVRSGETDVASHVAMAKFWLAKGETEKAARIADAVTLLNPADRDAWLCKAEVARAAGDAATAGECMAEAAAVDDSPVPFAIPGVAKA
jgi:tetratricopeptide (TPR) repeat protein